MMVKKSVPTSRLLQQIQRSPTAFQAVETISEILVEHGFIKLEENKKWSLVKGQKYFLTRNDSSVIAFVTPKLMPKQLLIAASHTDSPMFKLKSNYESVAFDRYLRLDTEAYGGSILSSWFDRPLSIAGRVIIQRNHSFLAKSIHINRDLLLIPNVAIHMNREINSGYNYNTASDLVPLFGEIDSKGKLQNLISEIAECKPDEIVGHDLYVYNRMPGIIWGVDNEFFSSPRIDNLMCAFGTLDGFCEAEPSEDSLNMYFSADNEETGSETKQGAGSSFLRDVLDRICENLNVDSRVLISSGFMVSADNGHARHPNHPELCDPLNTPHLNQGIVIKSNAAQHYATDGFSSAVFQDICSHANVPVQLFANRSDMRGGSTLGSIADTKVPIRTVDIGMAQLAMHSSYETAGCKDVPYLADAMRQFYSISYRTASDNEVSVCF